jgi:hypothetical protein
VKLRNRDASVFARDSLTMGEIVPNNEKSLGSNSQLSETKRVVFVGGRASGPIVVFFAAEF